MTSKQSSTTAGKSSTAKGPDGLIVVGNLAQIQRAAKTNPKLAELMKQTHMVGNDQKDVQPREKPANLHETLEGWKEQMRLEKSQRSGTEGDGSSWIDEFSMLVLGGQKASRSKTGPRCDALDELDTLEKEKDKTESRHEAEVKAETKKDEKKTNQKDETFEGQTKTESGGKSGNSEKRNYSQGPGGFMAFTNQDFDTDEAAQDEPSTPAEKLTHSLMVDKIPVDPVVREVFGFSKANNREEESCLLGLYQGLLLYLPDPPSEEDVQSWVETNKLAEGIQRSYKAQGHNSGYFRWFNKNQHLFDQTYQRPDGPRAPATNDVGLDMDRLTL